MEDRKYLPQARGEASDLSSSSFQPEPNSKVRAVRREPVITTRVRMEEHSDVPCKVPRFQYVDFPSLHQCIKQLSVPPLEGWLATCPLGKVPAHRPSSPKEKVPKFKYVDYPSLYHCIQQLSVPPLEIWSSKLTKPSPSGLRVQCPPQVLGGKNKEENRAGQQSKEKRGSGSTVHVPIPEPTVLSNKKDTQPSTSAGKNSNVDFSFGSGYVSRSESTHKAAERNEKRPSVISLVRTKSQKPPEERSERCKPPARITKLEQPINLTRFAPPDQHVFTVDPVEHQSHQCRHKDKVVMIAK